MESCERCAVLHEKLEKIRAILRGDDPPRGRTVAYLTPHGRLIAAAASAKGQTLAEVGRAVGYGAGNVAKICRGEVALTKRSALLIGGHLGILLLPFVGAGMAPVVQQDLPMKVSGGTDMPTTVTHRDGREVVV